MHRIVGQPQRWVFKPLTLLLPAVTGFGKRRCSTPLAIWCWQGCAPHCWAMR
ncbi:hypothetical protein ACP0HM_21130 [Escherichia coli]